jgi:hypothetical protein
MNRNNLEACASKLDRTLDILARNALWVVACWTLFYAALALFLAHEKPFWNDELFTFYISRLRSLSDIWKALLTGAEQLPPFFFVITRAFTAVFGWSEISFRLPEIFGFWLMSVCLFQFVRVRLPVMYAWIAMTFPLVTAAFDYAYEARPYGLILGFCGLALCCWQAAARGHLRTLSLAGLALSGAAAISCHYYAVLGLAAIFVGECARSFTKTRFDFGVWIALAASCTPLILFLPLIKAARSYSAAFWSKPQWANVFGFYNALLTPAALTLFALLIALGMYALTCSPHGSDHPSNRREIPICEIAVVLAFSLIPVVGVVLAKLATGAFNFRYALPAVIGLSILVAWSSSALVRHRTEIGLLLLLILFALSLANGIKAYLGLRGILNDRADAYKFVETEAKAVEMPLVIADPHLFFELSYDIAKRRSTTKVLYLADTRLALKYTDTDTVERGLLALKQWAPLDVRDFNQFCANHDVFLVYGYPAPFEWIVEDLIPGGWRLVAKGRNGSQLLYLVRRQREP